MYCSLLEASSLQGLAADFVGKVKTMSSLLLKNLYAPSKLSFVPKWKHFLELISSFDISPPHPKHHHTLLL